MPATDREVAERAGRVRMILLDVDGVLTDGRLHMGPGGYEGRSFHVRDGHGVRMGQRGGLQFGIVSGRESRVVTERAAELYITEVHQGVYDKAQCLDEILFRLRLDVESVCFVGDDLVDLPVLQRVGFAVTPSDACPETRAVAHYVTTASGGAGAVREVIDLVLRSNGKWAQATERYYK